MDTNIKSVVAKNIAFYRKQKKLSQKSLADMIGVKHNTISSWESCTNTIDIDNLYAICQVLNVSINTMYGINNAQLTTSTDIGIELYNQLDDNDKAEIRGEMKQMLKAEKYNDIQKELQNA